MKRAGLIVAIAVTLLVAQSLYAQEIKVQGRTEAWGGGMAGMGMYSQMIKECNLTEEQQAKIKAIEEQRNADVKAFMADNAEKLKAAQAAITEAYKSKDQALIQQAMKDYQTAYAPMGEIHKAAHAQVMGVLTPEQKAAWQQSQTMNMIKAIFYRAKLTDEQLEKAKAAYTMLAQEKDAKTEDIMRKLSDAVRELLTDDQKEAMKAPMNVWTRPANPAPGQAQPGAPVDPKAGEGLKIELKPGATIVQPGGGAGGATVIITEGDEKK